MTAVVTASGLVRRFVGGDGTPFTVLDGATLALDRGEVVAIVGASGSGKSTLLHLLAGLDRPDAGVVAIEGTELNTLQDSALAALRNRRVGLVFQFHHLLRDFTARENVAMPLLIDGVAQMDAYRRADAALEDVGLSQRRTSRVTVLSGGEQQRVALARALVNSPAVLLADEPTGNLDAHAAHAVHDTLIEVSRRREAAVVVVTHSRVLAARADRILTLHDGVLQSAGSSDAAW